MENSIEEDIKDIKKYISFTSKRENFSHDTDWNWNKDLANKIEHILSDYKRVLKENEELLEVKVSASAHNRILELEKENEELEEINNELEAEKNEAIRRYNFETIPKQKVKDKIEEEKLPLIIVGGKRNKKTLEYGIQLGRRQILQELLESEE